MAKGWRNFATINDLSTKEEKHTTFKREEKFRNGIKNIKILSIEDLKKESDELYDKKIAEEDKLLTAFTDKRIRSKEAIKQALKIKKIREKAKNNKSESESNKIVEFETPIDEDIE